MSAYELPIKQLIIAMSKTGESRKIPLGYSLPFDVQRNRMTLSLESENLKPKLRHISISEKIYSF